MIFASQKRDLRYTKVMAWKRIDTKIVYQNRWLRVREDTVIRPDGKRGRYSVVERPPVNFIIAVNRNNSIIFIREYRYPIKKTIIQLPAGTTNKNETDLSSAKKELLEETGLRARKWDMIGKFYIGPGHENIRANVFLASQLTASRLRKSRASNNEVILDVVELPLKQIKRYVASGKIECGITLAALNIFLCKQ